MLPLVREGGLVVARHPAQRLLQVSEGTGSTVAVELALTDAAVSVRRSMADQNILPCGTVGDSQPNNSRDGAYAAFIRPH